MKDNIAVNDTDSMKSTINQASCCVLDIDILLDFGITVGRNQSDDEFCWAGYLNIMKEKLNNVLNLLDDIGDKTNKIIKNPTI